MTALSIQLRKETRPLLLPWFVMMLVGALSLLLRRPPDDYFWRSMDLLNWVLPIGCFFGIPLLAALPLGNEFQHKTFTLLLAQSVDRKTLWRQKVAIVFAAVLPVAALYLWSARVNPEFEGEFWPAAVWIASSVSGSVAGTLIARSTIGGLALSSAFQGILFLIWNRLAETNRHNGNISSTFLWISTALLLFYSTSMVLLGRRMFLRFQAIDGGPAGLDAIPGAGFLPRIGANWFRCRPRGVILNLIRREFHLLRTVWLLGFFSLFIWICLVLLGIVRPSTNDGRAPLAAGIAATLSLVIALLAGALSLGEEKNWGTHAWQLTMPLSTSVQWLVKLLVALFTSVICAAAVPMSVLLVSGWVSGSPLLYFGDSPALWLYPLAAAVLTLMAFWTCCAVKGTVHAVIGFFVLLFSLALAIALGPWLGVQATSGICNLVVERLDPVRVGYVVSVLIGAEILDLGSTGTFPIIVLSLATVGLMQTRRMFLAPAAHSKKYMVQRAIPLVAICLLPSFALAAYFEFRLASWHQQVAMWTDVHNAIEAVQLARTEQEAALPQRLTMEALAKASPVTASTRKWLSNAQIVVVPETAPPFEGHVHGFQWPYEHLWIIHQPPNNAAASYSAVIHTASGYECNLSFWASRFNDAGFIYESCQ